MRKILPQLGILCCFPLASLGAVNIPDPNFRAWLSANYPLAMSGTMLDNLHPTVQATTSLNVLGQNIANLSGVWAFENLQYLVASDNPITNSGVHIPMGTAFVYFSNCLLTGSFTVPDHVQSIHLDNNQLTSIALASGTVLTNLHARNNLLTSITGQWSGLGVSADLAYNQLASLPGFAQNFYPGYLDVSHNQLTTLPEMAWMPGSTLLASHNLITSIGDQEFFYSYTTLDVSYNPLTGGIVELPEGLLSLTITNTQLPCLPWIPFNLQSLICTNSLFTCLPNIPPSLNTSPANFGFTPTVCGSGNTCHIPPPRARVKLLLQGPWNSAQQLMNDNLRQQGLIPLNEPYSAMGYPLTGNQTPTSIPASFLTTTGPNAIVDWVLVELRTGQNVPGSLVERRPALVQRDGDVIGTNGDTLFAYNRPRRSYHLAVRHRNHLGLIDFSAQSYRNGTIPRDFTYQYIPVGQTNAMVMDGARGLMVRGDVTNDHWIMYSGSGNDRDVILQAVGGTTPNATIPGYRREDVNLDGLVKYTGSNNDRDPILTVVGSTTPNYARQQLPIF